MKLAEALSLRADLQKRLSQMSGRLQAACKVQEGDQPAEQPEALLSEMRDNLAQLERLIERINRTNQQTRLADGMTITAKIARRDVLTHEVALLQELVEHLTVRPDRYSRQEIKYVTTVDVAALRKRMDDASRRLRETDTAIQGANWTVDLCE